MNKNDDPHRYDDIINRPHHVSFKRPHMSMRDRAAQFAPFAALTGHGDAIRETARLTEDRPELEEEQVNILNTKMLILQDFLSERPEVTFSCFCPDNKKSGGSFEIIIGKVKRISEFEGYIGLEDGRKVQMRNVLDMEGEIFSMIQRKNSI